MLNKFYARFGYSLFIFAFIMFILPISVSAENISNIDHTSYEMSDETGFVANESYRTTAMSYGGSSLGSFVLKGDLHKDDVFNGFPTYNASGEVTFWYNYDKNRISSDSEKWNITDSDSKFINGIKLSKKIGSGAVIVQSSGNNAVWNTVYENTDIFDTKTAKLMDFYTIPLSDVKAGKYYRVMIGYEMKRLTSVEGSVFKKENFEYKEFLEVYEFFVGYSNNAVVLRNIDSDEVILGNKVENGFVIDKCGSDSYVIVSDNRGNTQNAADKEAFYRKGTYTISFTSETGKEEKRSVEVVNGMQISKAVPKVYEGGAKGKYEETGLVNSSTSFGEACLSSLSISHPDGKESKTIKTSKKSIYDSYGVIGNRVGLYFSVRSPQSADYSFCDDNWGKNDKETVNGLKTGKIGTGVLSIQTSSDGVNWSSKYCATDYSLTNCDKGEKLVYLPNGNDILHGVFIKVNYAYEVAQNNGKSKTRCLETYNLYLCSNDLDAVTFHNLSLEDKDVNEKLGEDNEINYKMYRGAESLISESTSVSGTVKGFRVDTSMNPTVKYTIKFNGKEIQKSANNVYSETGRYDILMTSDVGDSKIVTIYVDRMSPKAAGKLYFGEGFINGKRIYSEDGSYPVYEAGGILSYDLSEVSGEFLPLGGTITNTTTNNPIDIEYTRSKKHGMLTEPGHYTAVLSTKKDLNDNEYPGDYRKYTIEFDVIAAGTAPGPQVNKKSLEIYGKSNISDCYPKYYGVAYPCAFNGREITVAFADKESALRYAYKVETASVEEYNNGLCKYDGKEYVKGMELTDDINKNAEKKVHGASYFDLTKDFCYCTIRENIIENIENLRRLEFAYSVIVFASEEDRSDLCKNTLPLISNKPYIYQNPGKDGTTDKGDNDFQFIKDKYGCDSNKVIIKDSTGKSINIEYNKGVGEQLDNAGCAAGIVTITESTIYGDMTTYQAMFIPSGMNTAYLTLKYTSNGKKDSVILSQDKHGEVITAQSFSIDDVTDDCDQFTLINVKYDKDNHYYVSDDLPHNVFEERKEYTIDVINRLGIAYSFTVNVVDPVEEENVPGEEITSDETTVIQTTTDVASSEAEVTTSSASKELPVEENIHNEKRTFPVIVIVLISAAVIIAGSVGAILIVKRKKGE